MKSSVKDLATSKMSLIATAISASERYVRSHYDPIYGDRILEILYNNDHPDHRLILDLHTVLLDVETIVLQSLDEVDIGCDRDRTMSNIRCLLEKHKNFDETV